MQEEQGPVITKLTLENFCGFSKYELDLMPLTVLVGPNNGGKTTVLRATKFLMDFLEIAMPQLRRDVSEFTQKIVQLNTTKNTNLAKVEETKTIAVAALEKQREQLDEKVRKSTPRNILNIYARDKLKATEAYNREYGNLMRTEPACACNAKDVATRQSVESIASFFFRHDQEKDAVLHAELTTTPAPTHLTLRISRQSNNNYLVSASFLVKGKPVWKLNKEVATAVFRSLERLKCSYIQPISTLCPSEQDQPFTKVQATINKGRPHDVWRNEFRWLTDGKSAAAFQRVVEAMHQAMPSVGLIMPRRTRDGSPRVMVEFEEGGMRYDVAESGNGFRTLLSIVACLELSDSPVCLFDEPDSHLHSHIQRELADFITASANPGRQVIVATHAPDMIDQFAIESQVWIDRSENAGRHCDDTTAALVELGAIALAEALESAGGPLLFLEAKPDRKVFRALCSKIHDASWLSECRLSDLRGFGDTKHLPQVARLVREHYNPDFKIAAIRDPDYSYPEETVTQPDQGALICYLPCKEIENLLLLQPQAIADALREAAKRAQPFTGETLAIPDAAQIAQYLDEIIQQETIKHVVSDQWIVNKMPTNHADAGDHRLAREGFEQFWAHEDNSARFCPGKQVLTELRNRVQSEFKITIPALPRLFEFYKPTDEVKRIIQAVKDHLTAPSQDVES